MMENQNDLTIKVKNIEERLEKLEKGRIEKKDQKIKELENEINKIQEALKNTIIIKPVFEGSDDNKRFIEEEAHINDLKQEHKGEILAFTRKDDELILVAHALFEKDLTDLISEARKQNRLTEKDKIFYR